MAEPLAATVCVWMGGRAAGDGIGRAGSLFALGEETDGAACRGGTGTSAGAAAVPTCADEGAEAGVAAEAKGATELGFKRAAISTTVQRRWGSRCKQ